MRTVDYKKKVSNNVVRGSNVSGPQTCQVPLVNAKSKPFAQLTTRPVELKRKEEKNVVQATLANLTPTSLAEKASAKHKPKSMQATESVPPQVKNAVLHGKAKRNAAVATIV